jgi:dTDP-4-amino-4,6-dideoxygalactose transaminase
LDALAQWAERDPSVIPFNRPHAPEALLRHLEEVANSGHHSGDGPMTHQAVAILTELYPEAAAVLLTSSCTHALELAAVILGVGPDDEVIVPAFTFVSTANAFALRGARIRFADIRSDTLCIDPDSIEDLLSDRTRVIVPVNYAGVGCDLDTIAAQAARVAASVVEDNAHGLFGRLNERPLGSFGAMSTLSFHETKNVSSGEGGALVINDPDLVLPAEIAREKGTNRTQFFRGLVDKYTWVGLGSSWLPSEFTAAVLLSGLESASWTQERRHFIWNTYFVELADWATSEGVRLPVVPPASDHPAHIFYLLLPSLDSRTRFITHLHDNGIQAVFHYIPLDTSPFGMHLDGTSRGCPVSQDVSERIVRLPLYADLHSSSLNHIVEVVRTFRC